MSPQTVIQACKNNLLAWWRRPTGPEILFRRGKRFIGGADAPDPPTHSEG